jgi:hypothetical protein
MEPSYKNLSLPRFASTNSLGTAQLVSPQGLVSERVLAAVKHQAALSADSLMNARMSALITSAFVVIMPCEKPG